MRKLLPIIIVFICAYCGDRLKPAATGSEITVAAAGQPAARVVVMCEGVATKESGSPETLKAFGEAYAFDPATFAVRRDQPTEVVFWNLQGHDEHDFMLLDSQRRV